MDDHPYGGSHSVACLTARRDEFHGTCPGPASQRHGWGLDGVAMGIREKSMASPLYFATQVLSRMWQANLFTLPSDAHLEVEQAMIAQEDLLYVDARGTGKTTLVDECGAVWQLVKHPNDSVAMMQSTEALGKAISELIRNHFVLNPALAFFFPDYHVEKADALGDVRSWNSPCRTIITKEGSFDVRTPGSSGTGSHYDLILASDLMNPDTTPPPCGRSTLETMKSIIAWYAQTDGLLKTKAVNPRAHRRIDSNRWHDGDLAGALMRKEDSAGVRTFRRVVRGVKRGPDGEWISTWPGVITSAELKAKHEGASMNPATWAANFQSDPLPEGGMAFLDSDFVDYDREPKGLADIAITVDPAFSDSKTESKKTDRSAMVVSGLAPSGDLYVLDTRAGRWGVTEFIENLFALIDLWKPAWVGIEDTGGSRAIIATFMQEARQTGRWVNYREIKPGGKSKQARIGPLHHIARRWKLFVKRAQHQELMEELLRFGVAEHDDLADALAYRAMEIYGNPVAAVVRAPEGPARRLCDMLPEEALAFCETDKRPKQWAWQDALERSN